jgi:outer membrane immunogenic protein
MPYFLRTRFAAMILVAAGLAFPAAAEPNGRVAAPVYKAPFAMAAYDWSGFYLGGNVGYGIARNSVDTVVINNATGTLNGNPQWKQSPAGRIAGGQVGFNWQTSHWVLGLEADLQAADQSDSSCLLGCSPSDAAALRTDQQIKWFGTVRGRAGYATGSALLYATGGFAYGKVETHLTEEIQFNSNVTASDSGIKTGWTAGGGIEAVITGNWSGKVEYLYMDLGSVSVAPFNSPSGFTRVNFTSDIRNHIARVGLNYRFGGSPRDQDGLIGQPGGWSGLYVGLNGGYGVARNSTSAYQTMTGDIFDDSWSLQPAGWVGGGQIGYNWQRGSWIAGLEADFQASGQRDAVCVLACGLNLNAHVEQDISWFGTVRGRLGYDIGSAMFYATGGWAYANVETSLTESNTALLPTPVTVSNTAIRSGWTIGGGTEAAIVGNWTIKAEYLYLDLGANLFAFNNVSPTAPTVVYSHKLESHITDHVFRVGLNYRFDSDAAGGAKY